MRTCRALREQANEREGSSYVSRSRKGRRPSEHGRSAEQGNFGVFEEVFADDFVDHTPQPNMIPTKRACGACTALLVRPFRLPRRDPLAGSRRGPGDNIQDVSRDPQGSVSGCGSDRSEGPLRNGRRHASAQRPDHRALGRGEPVFSHAAARRVARHAASVDQLRHFGRCALGSRRPGEVFRETPFVRSTMRMLLSLDRGSS